MTTGIMKIVVIGGTGLIGSRVVSKLRAPGLDAVAAAPSVGVNAVTGEGLVEVLKDASVVVDVSNARDREDAAVLKFFETSTHNLLLHEASSGVRHHIELSVVGTERMVESGYMRAELAQENLIKASRIPYSIVRATQFYESCKDIAGFATEGNKVHLPHVLFQPMAADDVASCLYQVAMDPALNRTVDVGGPEQLRLDDFVRQALAAWKDPRAVVTDPHGRYYGIAVGERTLLPDNARLGSIRFEDWLAQSATQRSQPAA